MIIHFSVVSLLFKNRFLKRYILDFQAKDDILLSYCQLTLKKKYKKVNKKISSKLKFDIRQYHLDLCSHTGPSPSRCFLKCVSHLIFIEHFGNNTFLKCKYYFIRFLTGRLLFRIMCEAPVKDKHKNDISINE